MNTKIIAVGKKHESIYQEAIAHYKSRLKLKTSVSWDIISHSSLDGVAARNEESSRILARLKPDDYVVLLDEFGELTSSEQFAAHIEHVKMTAQSLVYIIGGAYGVDDALKNRSRTRISFGRMVLPHQLMRVVLLEQIYRAHSIQAGSKYHHE